MYSIDFKIFKWEFKFLLCIYIIEEMYVMVMQIDLYSQWLGEEALKRRRREVYVSKYYYNISNSAHMSGHWKDYDLYVPLYIA